MSYKDRRNSKYGDIYDYDDSSKVNRNIPKKKSTYSFIYFIYSIFFNIYVYWWSIHICS